MRHREGGQGIRCVFLRLVRRCRCSSVHAILWRPTAHSTVDMTQNHPSNTRTGFTKTTLSWHLTKKRWWEKCDCVLVGQRLHKMYFLCCGPFTRLTIFNLYLGEKGSFNSIIKLSGIQGKVFIAINRTPMKLYLGWPQSYIITIAD